MLFTYLLPAILGIISPAQTLVPGNNAIGAPEAAQRPESAEQEPSAALDSSEAQRPNVLFLFGDDQRADAIGALGNPGIQTPNLDSLVHKGVSFRRAYCLGSSTAAVCSPSRAMLHTGRAYHRIGTHSLDGEILLGELMGEAGYRTFGTGKWHNGRASFARSFEEGHAVFFGGMSDHNQVPLVDMPERGTFENERSSEAHSTPTIADAAVDWLGTSNGDAPWFCYVSFTAPHDPRDPPAEWLERERPPLPPNFLPQHPFDCGMLQIRDEKLAGWPRDKDVVRDQLREYYALIEHLDHEVGRVLEAAESASNGRPTLIVYAADHGLAMGSHGLLGKQNLYEHSMRAPMILAGAGLPEGQGLTALTYLHDLFPTVLGLAGAAPAHALDGRDLRPLWEGRATGVRDSLYLSMQRTQRAVTDGRWKLIVYPQVHHSQLFDLAADPFEMVDLHGNPAFAHHALRLEQELERWRAELGDTAPLRVEDPKPLEIDLSNAKRKPDRFQPEWIREKYFPKPTSEPAKANADKR